MRIINRSLLFCIVVMTFLVCLGIAIGANEFDYTFEILEKKYAFSTLKVSESISGNEVLVDPADFRINKSEPEQVVLDYLRDFFLLRDNILLTEDDIKITVVQKTPGGTIVRFYQMVEGIPVYMTNSSISFNNEGEITRENIYIRPDVIRAKGILFLMKEGIIDEEKIREHIKTYLELSGDNIKIFQQELVWFESFTSGITLTWSVDISSEKGLWRICLDAENGLILQAGLSGYGASVDGWGYVFEPDPLTSAHTGYGGNYVNNYDADHPALNAERKLVRLQDITFKDGKYTLDGPYCVFTNFTDYFGPVPPEVFPERTDNNFLYTREEEGFETVMCYYYIDQSARYIKSLGYWDKDGDPEDGLDRIQVDPHGSTYSNTYHISSNTIYFQECWPNEDIVDGAEDADIILHEYCHAIHHHIGPGLPIEGLAAMSEAKAFVEGSADYWAISHKASLGPYQCKFAYWHSKGHTDFSRSADVDFAYPYERHGYVAGQIWSSALMDIWWKLGKKTTDTLFLETLAQAHVQNPVNYRSKPSLTKAAMIFLDADFNIYQGRHYKEILQSFDKYGLIQYIDQIPYQVRDSNHIYRTDLGEDYERYDDFDLPGEDGADNEHFLHLNHPARLNISTSSSYTNFDTKLQVLSREGTVLYNADNGIEPDPSQAMLSNIALDAGSYYIVVDGNNGEVGEYELSVDYVQPLEVYILDEQLESNNMVQPRLYLNNKSELALSDFTVRYYFTVENGETPEVEDYWTPNFSISLEQLGGNEWCAVLDYSGCTLHPGGRVPESSGEVFSMHYNDWSTWDKSNDYSQAQNGNTYILTDKIAVFDSNGTLVYGSEP